jgi:hypothetical protein
MPVSESLDLTILGAQLSALGGRDIETEFPLVFLVPFCRCSVVLREQRASVRSVSSRSLGGQTWIPLLSLLVLTCGH